MKKQTVQRLISLLLVIVLLWVGLPTAALPTTSGEDRIQNGGFETGDTSGWTVPPWCASGVSVGTAYAKEGQYGVSITGGWSNVVQTVSVNPNTDYELSFWVKGYAVVYVKNTSGADVRTVWPENYAVWTKVAYTIPSGDNATLTIEINCGENTALVDSVQMVPVLDNLVTGGLGSVTEMGDTVAVAFRFTLDAQVVANNHNFVSGTVAPIRSAKSYPLVRMGAVMTNDASLIGELTLDNVNGTTCRDIIAQKVTDVTEDSVSYAVRIINIPANAKKSAVYARPYYVYRDGDREIAVYSPTVYEESYNTIADRVNFTDESEWELYWNDEFGGDALDSTKWNTANYPGNIQYNTNRPENVKVEGGDLVLTARKEDYEGKSFSSGSISSDYKFSVLYGRIEIRAKLAWGKGIWPALWTMGDLYLGRGDTDGWPYGGEIDILELVGETDVTEHKKWPWSSPTYEHTSNKYNEANRTATHNIHWGSDRDNHCEVGGLGDKGYRSKYLYPEDDHPADGYHIYALEWDYRDLKFFIDDMEVGHIWWDDEYIYSRNGDSAVYSERLSSYRQADGTTGTTAEDLDRAFSGENNPHWLILGLGLCEGWTTSGVNTTDGTDMPASMYVDYVRVYKKK